MLSHIHSAFAKDREGREIEKMKEKFAEKIISST